MAYILASGGAGVPEDILKRQETYGVAFALVLGCALAVMALASNQQGADIVCNIGPKDIKDQCWAEQFASDGHCNLNYAKLQQAKLKLKLCKIQNETQIYVPFWTT